MRTILATSLSAICLVAVAVLAAPKPLASTPAADRSSVSWDVFKFPHDPEKRALVNGVFRTLHFKALQPDGLPLQEVRTVRDLAQVSATLEVEMASLDSGIGLRDERLRHVLFETPKFPQARFDLRSFRFPKGDPSDEWKSGDHMAVSVSGNLTLHGVSRPLHDVMLEAQVEDDGVLLKTAAPIRLEPAQFGLSLPALEKVCGHSIDSSANVQVQLFFKRG